MEESNIPVADAGAENESKVSPFLVTAIGALLLMIFLLAGLIVNTVFFEKKVPRTALERDIFEAENVLKTNPRDPNAHLALGLSYMHLGDLGKAESEMKLAIKYDASFADAYYQLGMLQIKRKSNDEAKSYFIQATKKQPLHAFAYYQHGVILVDEKQYKDAIKVLQQSVKANPMYSDPHYWLGFSYEKLGRKSEAIGSYREALKYIPDYKEAQAGLKRLGAK